VTRTDLKNVSGCAYLRSGRAKGICCRRSRWIAAVLAVALLSPTNGWADTSDKAAAIAAFDEAAALMKTGDLESACAKYEESYTLEPQLGTLLHLGNCQEQAVRLASAWSTFRDAADWAKKTGDKRHALAEERAKLLEPRLSRLQLLVPGDLPVGANIERNGKALPPSVYRSAMPLDQGHYEITVMAPGYQTWTGTIELTKEGQVLNLGIPTLQKIPQATTEPQPLEPRGAPERSLVARKWPSFVAGGVALAGGVVWGVFGVQSMQAKASAQNATGYTEWQLQQEAYSDGTVATVGMIVAGVGVAATVTLWALLPGKKASAEGAAGSRWDLQARVGPNQVQLRGSF
jgi:PEGA domain